ncbi:MAG: hypothetical protein RI897_2826 [Verrucomicrobiota bacterium]
MFGFGAVAFEGAPGAGFEEFDGAFGPEVGDGVDGAVGGEEAAADDVHAEVVAERVEVEDTEEVGIGGAVPGGGEGLGDGGASGEEELEAGAPVGEVGEGDDDLSADAEGFTDDLGGVDEFLEGAEEHDEVEGVFAILVEAIEDIALVDDEVSFDAFADAGGVAFDAFDVGFAFEGDAFEEGAIAAAEVEDAGLGRDPGEDFVVEVAVHGWAWWRQG